MVPVSPEPTPRRRPRAWDGRALAVMLLFVVPELSAGPAGPDGPDPVADCQLTVRARQACLTDDLLAPFNLGVSVRGRVATLWGPVPTASLSRRAEERVRAVDGIAAVVNRLVVENPADPLLDFLRAPRKPEPARPPEPPRAAPAPPAGALTGRATDTGPPPPPAATWRPARRDAKHESGAPPGPGGAPVNVITRMPSIPLPVPPTGTAAGTTRLADEVERLRLRNHRLYRVRAAVEGPVVHLTGTVASWVELMAFARDVSRLPGVERVRLEGVQTDPGPPPDRR